VPVVETNDAQLTLRGDAVAAFVSRGIGRSSITPVGGRAVNVFSQNFSEFLKDEIA